MNSQMPQANDMDLLLDYARRSSETAFAELVQRHLNLVYSAALRRVGSPAHAEEITQAVFVILARKAAGLRPDTVLESWLYETTRLTALSFLRCERRRQLREQEAYMQSTIQEPAPDSLWSQLAPLLDQGMARLGKEDRQAVILRFFKQKSVREVATAMRVNEAAAQRRILRALEKLRKFFAGRGVSSTATIIAGAISAHSVQAAPVTLAKTVAAMAITKGAAASGSTLALVKGALKFMAWAKAKSAMLVAVGALLLVGTATVTLKIIQTYRATHSASWRTADISQQTLDLLPPQIAILPSTFSGPGRRGIRGPGSGGDRKMVGFGFKASAIFAAAYGRNDARIIFIAPEPGSRYDFICTLPSHQAAALQDELRNVFGLTATLQMRETDVLLLTVKHPNSPSLRPSAASPTAPASLQGLGRGHLSGRNAAMASLANDLEQRLGVPIVDQTASANRRFDFDLAWDQSDPMLNIDDLKQALSDELGLELLPARKSTEMAVVENANK